jgi:hypothetical protein
VLFLVLYNINAIILKDIQTIFAWYMCYTLCTIARFSLNNIY